MSRAHDVGRVIRGLLYRGPGECNLCGARVRFTSISRQLGRTLAEYEFSYALDDFETLNHRDYLCPLCGASDRDRLYKLYVDRFLQPDGLRRIVDFAPAPSLSAYLRGRSDLQYRTADLMMSDVDDVVDIMDMTAYVEGEFDFFICSHVLEHVPDDGRALAELYRILAPGGRGIVMTPVLPDGSFDEDPTVSDERERWRRFAQGDHLRLYDRSTLCARIRRCGFELSELDRNTFGDETFARHGLALSSVLYVVRKPAIATR